MFVGITQSAFANTQIFKESVLTSPISTNVNYNFFNDNNLNPKELATERVTPWKEHFIAGADYPDSEFNSDNNEQHKFIIHIVKTLLQNILK